VSTILPLVAFIFLIDIYWRLVHKVPTSLLDDIIYYAKMLNCVIFVVSGVGGVTKDNELVNMKKFWTIVHEDIIAYKKGMKFLHFPQIVIQDSISPEGTANIESVVCQYI